MKKLLLVVFLIISLFAFSFSLRAGIAYPGDFSLGLQSDSGYYVEGGAIAIPGISAGYISAGKSMIFNFYNKNGYSVGAKPFSGLGFLSANPVVPNPVTENYITLKSGTSIEFSKELSSGVAAGLGIDGAGFFSVSLEDYHTEFFPSIGIYLFLSK